MSNSDVSKKDKNFEVTKATDFASNVYKMPHELFTIYGGWFDETYGFVKMPPETAKDVTSGVFWGSRCTAGVRITFATNSYSIKLKCKPYQKAMMHHMAQVASSGFTLCEDVDGEERFVGNFYPPFEYVDEFEVQLNLNGRYKLHKYVLYLPLYSGVQDLSIELIEGSKVEKFEKYQDKKPLLYYGSSITQGGCASRADNTYQAHVSNKYNMDYVTLGFSGLARGESNMAKYLGTVDCSVFICDYDYNAQNLDHLIQTHLPLYKEFRANEKNKNTPIIFMSKPDGFRTDDGNARYNIIKRTYEYAKKNGDKNVYLIDGRKIYPRAIREHCSVDGCHPTDLGFYYMFKALDRVLCKIL